MNNAEAFYLVICGLSASGKTSLVRALEGLDSVLVVPEHVDWIGGSENFPGEPTTVEEKKEKQRFFMNLDIERYGWVRDHIGDAELIVADCDFLGPLAHNYAERWLGPEFDVYGWSMNMWSFFAGVRLGGLMGIYIWMFR